MSQNHTINPSSYTVEGKHIDFYDPQNIGKLPSVPFKEYKKHRNNRTQLNTMPVPRKDKSETSNFIPQSGGHSKFRVVTLPPFSQDSKGAAAMRVKATWSKLAENNRLAETLKQTKQSTISHHKSQSALDLGEPMKSIDFEKSQLTNTYKQKQMYLRSEQKPPLSQAKPFGFLAQVGGKNTHGAKFSLATQFILSEEMQKSEQTNQIAIFTGMSVDKKNQNKIDVSENTEKLFFFARTSSRRLDEVKNQTVKTKYIVELEEDRKIPQLNLKRESIQKMLNNTISIPIQSTLNSEQNLTQHKTMANYKETVKNLQFCNKYDTQIKRPGDELPYPEIFDRAERTIGATFSKIGDLNYFTPSQRIGCFMDFNQRIKKKHLIDLINYMKNTKMSLRAAEDDEKDQKTDQEYLEQSLFHGHMFNEEIQTKKLVTYELDTLPEITGLKKNHPMIQITAYNPCSGQDLMELRFDKTWSNVLISKVEQSINRMLHYIESPDLIKSNEIAQYPKIWMSKALELINDLFLNDYEDLVSVLFQEIFRDYQRAMKVAIMEYVLLSPNERKRLNIIMLPKVSINATDLQIKNGGYNTVKYKGTHLRKLEAEKQIKQKLIINNIVISQLNSWSNEFVNFNLVDFKSIKNVIASVNALNKLQYQTLDLDNLFGYFDAYFQKSVALLKHIWFRGSILIIKKFKLLQLQTNTNSYREIWTFQGPSDIEQTQKKGESLTKDTKHHTSLSDYNLRTSIVHQTVPLKVFRHDLRYAYYATPKSQESLNETATLDSLIDIRSNSAYLRFIQSIGGTVDLSVNGYERLEKQYKRELKFAGGNFMRRQMREIVDRSVANFVNYFKGFPTFKNLIRNNQIVKMRELKPQITKIQSQNKPAKKEALPQYVKKPTLIKQEEQKIQDKEDKQFKMKELRIPEFLQLQDFFNPILRIQLLLGSNQKVASEDLNQIQYQLTFSHGEEQILKEFEIFFDRVVRSLNNFSRPEVCKIKVISQKKYNLDQYEATEALEKQKKNAGEEHLNKRITKRQSSIVMQTNNEAHSAFKQGLFQEELASSIYPQVLDFETMMFSNIFKNNDAYKNFFGRIQVVEPDEDVQKKKICSENQQTELTLKDVFSKIAVDRKQAVSDPNEEVYRQQKKQLLGVIKDHLIEIKNVKQLFEQFEDVISGNLQQRVQLFIKETKQTCEKIEDFRSFVQEAHYYRQLINQLPIRVAFPLFEIGLQQVKTELSQRVEGSLQKILQFFEADLLQQSKVIISVFESFGQILKRDIATVQDVIDIDVFKNNMIVEMAQLQLLISKQKKCIYFLISNNDLPGVFEEPFEENGIIVRGECYALVQKSLKWPNQIQQLIQSAEDRHQAQRLMIENQIFENRKAFEKDLAEISLKIKKSNSFNDMKNYTRAYNQVKELKTAIDEIKKTASQLEIQETQLFGVTQKSKILVSLCEQFEPNYLMWKTVSQLQTKLNRWQGSPMDQIVIAEVEQMITRSQQNIDRIRKTKAGVSDQDASVKVLNQLQRETENLSELYELIKVLSSDLLQDVHWTQIKQIVGSESINLKKMNLSGVIALDLRSVTPQFVKVLERAQILKQIEVDFSGIVATWTHQRLQTVNFEETTYHVFDADELNELTEMITSQLQKIQSFIQNQESASIQQKLIDQRTKLQKLHEFIRLVGELQAHYLDSLRLHIKMTQDPSITAEIYDLQTFNQFDQLWHLVIAKIYSERYIINVNVKQDFLEKMMQEIIIQKNQRSLHTSRYQSNTEIPK